MLPSSRARASNLRMRSRPFLSLRIMCIRAFESLPISRLNTFSATALAEISWGSPEIRLRGPIRRVKMTNDTNIIVIFSAFLPMVNFIYHNIE